MATRLKVVDDPSDLASDVPPPTFDPAPTRNRLAGWTADRQRTFIDILSLTGSVGEASAAAGVSSRSAYRLRNRAGADGFARAWDFAQQMSATRPAATDLDRAIDERVEHLGMSNRLVTWLLAHLDPVQYGGAGRQAMPRSAHRGA